MSNKHAKLKKKPTIEQFMRAQIMKIKIDYSEKPHHERVARCNVDLKELAP